MNKASADASLCKIVDTDYCIIDANTVGATKGQITVKYGGNNGVTLGSSSSSEFDTANIQYGYGSTGGPTGGAITQAQYTMNASDARIVNACDFEGGLLIPKTIITSTDGVTLNGSEYTVRELSANGTSYEDVATTCTGTSGWAKLAGLINIPNTIATITYQFGYNSLVSELTFEPGNDSLPLQLLYNAFQTQSLSGQLDLPKRLTAIQYGALGSSGDATYQTSITGLSFAQGGQFPLVIASGLCLPDTVTGHVTIPKNMRIIYGDYWSKAKFTSIDFELGGNLPLIITSDAFSNLTLANVPNFDVNHPIIIPQRTTVISSGSLNNIPAKTIDFETNNPLISPDTTQLYIFASLQGLAALNVLHFPNTVVDIEDSALGGSKFSGYVFERGGTKPLVITDGAFPAPSVPTNYGNIELPARTLILSNNAFYGANWGGNKFSFNDEACIGPTSISGTALTNSTFTEVEIGRCVTNISNGGLGGTASQNIHFQLGGEAALEAIGVPNTCPADFSMTPVADYFTTKYGITVHSSMDPSDDIFNCSGLKMHSGPSGWTSATNNVILPKNLVYVSGGAFSPSGFPSISFEMGGTKPLTINGGAFSGANLGTSVMFPARTIEISNGAFSESAKNTSDISFEPGGTQPLVLGSAFGAGFCLGTGCSGSTLGNISLTLPNVPISFAGSASAFLSSGATTTANKFASIDVYMLNLDGDDLTGPCTGESVASCIGSSGTNVKIHVPTNGVNYDPTADADGSDTTWKGFVIDPTPLTGTINFYIQGSKFATIFGIELEQIVNSPIPLDATVVFEGWFLDANLTQPITLPGVVFSATSATPELQIPHTINIYGKTRVEEVDRQVQTTVISRVLSTISITTCDLVDDCNASVTVDNATNPYGDGTADDQNDGFRQTDDIIPTADGTLETVDDQVLVDTNAPGYSLSVRAIEYTSMLNAVNPFDATTYSNSFQIPATSGTVAVPTLLADNISSWGFRVDNDSKFSTPNTYAGLTLDDVTVTTKNSGPYTRDVTPFLYGVKVTTSQHPGWYAGRVLYTATALQ